MHGISGTGGRHGSANIPKDYAFVTALNSPVRDSQADVYKSIDAYVKTFIRQFEASGERIKSLYLYSQNSGTGKTTTAIGCLNSYLITHYIGSLQRGIKQLDRPVFFLEVAEFQNLYNAFNRNKVPEEIAELAAEKYYRWMKCAQETPFVVLDDVGTRSSTEGFRGDLHSIINARVTNQLPTVYTSNVPISELPNIFGEQRLADRVRDMTITLLFNGESKRGRR
jgi:DNA replication protein DnaC